MQVSGKVDLPVRIHLMSQGTPTIHPVPFVCADNTRFNSAFNVLAAGEIPSRILDIKMGSAESGSASVKSSEANAPRMPAMEMRMHTSNNARAAIFRSVNEASRDR